ncbi:MAG: hypothetical protein ACYTBX_09255 [Planctomycetota bacterium]|jgi:hypothetical protein
METKQKTTKMLAILVLLLGLMVSAANATLTLPYHGTTSTEGKAFWVSNTYEGAGMSYGGFFYAAGEEARGVFGQSMGSSGIGVKGWAANAGDVENYGGHFTSTGGLGIGVYGWAENTGDVQNYGGFFLADGNRGIGLFAMGGPNGLAGEFVGDILLKASVGADPGDIIFQTSDGAQKARIWSPPRPDVDGLLLSSRDNLADICIDGEGNVGIGTTTPVDKLEVEGGLTVDGGGALCLIRLRQNNTMMWTFLTAPWLGSDDLYLRNESTGIDVMTFDAASNNIGIGTVNPLGKLDVNGSIYHRGSQLHADYVYEPGYELESIEEHSEYMWQHKHLAAIPKAVVDDNGQEIVEVGAHRKGIVEELEKAHIYIEQLHKRIKALEEKLVRPETELSAAE